MIVPMKKVTVLVLEKERRTALLELKKLGVLHVDAVQGDSLSLEGLKKEQDLLLRALSFLPAVKKEPPPRDVWDYAAALDLAREIVGAREALDRSEEQARELQAELDRLAGWGEIDPERINELAAKGVHVRLLECAKNDLKKMPARTFVVEVRPHKKLFLVAAASFSADTEYPGKPVRLPAVSTAGLRAERNNFVVERKALSEKLESLVSAKQALSRALEMNGENTEFEEVKISMNRHEPVLSLAGYVPAPDTEKIKTAARGNGWGLLIADPADDDDVPTLTRNPAFVRIIRPVFEFLGTVPGYREKDISLFFLAFFSVFYGMIVGDAAYGCIFLILSVLIRFVGPRSRKKTQFSMLLALTSVMTIIWGAVNGTWFGVDPQIVMNTPPFSWFVIPPLVQTPSNDTTGLLMHLCLIIGAVHLTLAHIWAFLSKLPRLKGFADLGWIAMIWGGFFIIRYLVLKIELFFMAPYLFLGGFLAVLLFSEQNGKFFKGMLSGVAKFPFTFLSSISALADIISYVRLFAVGLAGVKVEEAFNNMAQGFGFQFPNIIGAALILLFGHGLNLALGIMSVIVHGVRLNMLEFSGHLGQEWSGRHYRPFKTRE